MSYLLGIDIGTSGTKSAIFNEKGELMASATAEYPLYQPKNGWAEQAPEDWWKAVCETVSATLKKSGIKGEEISGIGMSGQMHGLVMLDENGQVLRRSIIWCDQRTQKEADELEKTIGNDKLIEITANPALTGFTAAKILWVKNNEPEIYARCKHILLPKDYIRFMLTGVYATEVSDASGMQLLDVPNRCWSDEILAKLDIDKALLGKIYESPDITGYVTEDAAKLTGLKVGIPVVGGAADNAAAAIGMGVVKDGKGFVTIGTSGVVFAHTASMCLDKKGRIHTLCSAVPGEWLVMGVTQAAGLSLKWFKENFCAEEIALANQTGQSVYKILDDMADSASVGANGIYYLPYLMGERTPHLDSKARGAFVGLSASHTKSDMIRAVIEGVTYSLKDCLNVFAETGVSLDSMFACGGGASSSLWSQMLADCFECEIKCTHSAEGAALGAALLAGVGSGVYKDVFEACDTVCKTKKAYLPNHSNSLIYRQKHEQYDKLYPYLKSFFTETVQ